MNHHLNIGDNLFAFLMTALIVLAMFSLQHCQLEREKIDCYKATKDSGCYK